MTTCCQVNNLLYAQLVIWDICKKKNLIVCFLQITNYFELWILTLICLNLPSLKGNIFQTQIITWIWNEKHNSQNIKYNKLWAICSICLWEPSKHHQYHVLINCRMLQICYCWIITCWEQFKIWRWEFSFVGDLIKNFGNTNMELLWNVIS